MNEFKLSEDELREIEAIKQGDAEQMKILGIVAVALITFGVTMSFGITILAVMAAVVIIPGK